jgi:hypothetical protein
MSRFAQIFAILALAAMAMPAQAAEKMRFMVDKSLHKIVIAGRPTLYADGPIDEHAPAHLMEILSKHRLGPGTIMYFNSPGGSLSAALALGRVIREAGLNTGVGAFAEQGNDRSGVCMSACAYAYFGGQFRYFSRYDKSRFGLHQFYASNSTVGSIGTVQQVSAAIIAYLTEMGVNPMVFTISAQAGAGDMIFLSAPEMEALGMGPIYERDLAGHLAEDQERCQPVGTVRPAEHPPGHRG